MPDLESAKRAVKAAADYYKQLVPKIKPSKLLVEEIEFIDASKEYRITLSHPQEDNDSIFASDKREYKIFTVKVDADTTTVKSMRIRD